MLLEYSIFALLLPPLCFSWTCTDSESLALLTFLDDSVSDCSCKVEAENPEGTVGLHPTNKMVLCRQPPLQPSPRYLLPSAHFRMSVYPCLSVNAFQSYTKRRFKDHHTTLSAYLMRNSIMRDELTLYQLMIAVPATKNTICQYSPSASRMGCSVWHSSIKFVSPWRV